MSLIPGSGIARRKIVDAQGGEIRFDPLTNALVGISLPHHKIHKGKMFSSTTHNVLGIDDQTRILITIPASCYPHFILGIRGGGELSGILYEASSYSDIGVARVSRNKNRTMPDSSCVSISTTPTIVVTGTLIDQQYVGAGRTGGLSRSEEEWILNAGTDYLFILTSLAAGNNACSTLLWYEKSNGT